MGFRSGIGLVVADCGGDYFFSFIGVGVSRYARGFLVLISLIVHRRGIAV